MIAESITLDICKELIFLHALSGSDCMLSFFPVRKVKLSNSWLVNQDLPEAFTHLGNCPSLLLREEHINVIERLIIPLCYDNSNWFSTDLG